MSNRLPVTEHTNRPWRIHAIAPDFPVEDVWALPVTGGADEFPAVLEVMTALEFPDSASWPVRFLWGVRDQLGRLGFGRISRSVAPGDDGYEIPGTDETTLADRLPADLCGTVDESVVPKDKPFESLYMTDREYASEGSNRTVHGVMHVGWVDKGDGLYQAQMAVLVKPRGRLGAFYMGLIKPFRYALIYPALMRAIDRAWRAHGPVRLSPARDARHEP
jgi:hypothetical protein